MLGLSTALPAVLPLLILSGSDMYQVFGCLHFHFCHEIFLKISSFSFDVLNENSVNKSLKMLVGVIGLEMLMALPSS